MIRRRGARSVIITVGLLVGLLGARPGSGMVLGQEQSGEALSAEALVEKMARAFRAV